MKVKEESEKIGLKLNIQKTKMMTSGPITSWQIDGETLETLADFIFLGSKITAHGDCSHEIKRHLLLVQRLKHLPAMRETWVRSLGWEVPWRRKWQPTPVLLPRKSHRRRSLVSMGLQRVRHD